MRLAQTLAVFFASFIFTSAYAVELGLDVKKSRVAEVMHALHDLNVATAATVSRTNIAVNPRQRQLAENFRQCVITHVDVMGRDFSLDGESCPIRMTHRLLNYEYGRTPNGDPKEHRDTEQTYAVLDSETQALLNMSTLREQLGESSDTLVSAPIEHRTWVREIQLTRPSGEVVDVWMTIIEFTNMENQQKTLRVKLNIQFSGSATEAAFKSEAVLKKVVTDDEHHVDESTLDGVTIPYQELEAILVSSH